MRERVCSLLPVNLGKSYKGNATQHTSISISVHFSTHWVHNARSQRTDCFIMHIAVTLGFDPDSQVDPNLAIPQTLYRSPIFSHRVGGEVYGNWL